MNCPKCLADNFVKNGFALGRQRYRCMDCRYLYTVPARGKPKEVKRLALHMYLEGLGFRSIGRVLGVSDVAVLKWIREAGQRISELTNTKPSSTRVEVMELDELWHFVSQKKSSAGSGWLLIEVPRKFFPTKPAIVASRRD
jgi:transposase-like protein